jgi:Asp-tRNA(Asn)/Glu-tRNA(Gln) amidotransferase A subunit family amidase
MRTGNHLSAGGVLDGRDATALAELVAQREVSAAELLEAAIARADASAATLNAVPIRFDDEARSRAAQELSGPFAGVPFLLKDIAQGYAGQRHTAGSAPHANRISAEHSAYTRRCLDAGLVIFGRTATPEFGLRAQTESRLWGPSRNPWDTARTPGGSSGGSAAAVAGGVVPMAGATDGGGSIRIPASFCGVVGHKPTFGVVPKEAGFKGWKTLSVHGPITRSVRDAAAMLSAMAGVAPADDLSYPVELHGLDDASPADLSGTTIAYSEDLGMLAVDRDVRDVFGKSLLILEELGASLYEAHPATGNPTDLWNTIALTEGYASEGPLLANWRDRMYPGTAELVEGGRDTTGAQYVDALHEKARYTRTWSEFFESYDLLVMPTMQLTAFPTGLQTPAEIEGRPVDPFFDDWCTIALPANLTGMPATSVPAGFGANGMPIGLQFMGPRFSDVRTLRAAAAFENLLPWTSFLPPVR